MSKVAEKDDAELIQATLDGDTDAFGQLVQKYQDRLFNTAVHIVGSPDDALDVVQDAFVQAFLKLSTFKGSSAFYTWLYRIAFNTCISHRRRSKPTLSVDHAKEASGGEPVDETGGPDSRIMQQEKAAQVQTALNRLTEDHRAILVLREMEGCCYETIAEILELPVGTVRSRLHRARMHLKDELKTVLQEELS